MSLRKFVTALTAVSLAAAPTVASAQVGAPLAPAEESVEGSRLDGDSGFNQLIPILIMVVVVLLARELTKSRDPGDPPISP